MPLLLLLRPTYRIEGRFSLLANLFLTDRTPLNHRNGRGTPLLSTILCRYFWQLISSYISTLGHMWGVHRFAPLFMFSQSLVLDEVLLL